MSRSAIRTSLLSFAALLAVAVAIAPSALARDGATAPRAVFCGATGSGPGATLATVPGAAWLREGASAKDRWYLLVTSNTPCDEARALVPELTAKAVSRGTVARAAAVIRGWHCTIDRDARAGGCSVLLGGSPRYLVVYPQNDLGMNGSLTVFRGLIGLNDITPTAQEPTGPAPAPTPAPDPDRYSGARAQRCTAIAGATWRFADRAPAGWPRSIPYPVGRTGDGWRVWALGGLPCLAAQGWVADLSPRVMRNATGLGGLRTDTQWNCLTGGGELLVGLCIRGTSPRGPFDHRGVIIAPDIADAYLPVSPTSYEEVWHAMLAFNAAAETALTRPQVCLERSVPSARWTVGAESGTRWILGGTGGYICGLLLNGGALDRLAVFAAEAEIGAFLTGGVDGQWRCTRNAGSKLRCYNPQAGTRFRLVLHPYTRAEPYESLVAGVLRALR